MIKLSNEQIEKALLYVTGKMDAKDRIHFEKIISENQALQHEVKLQKRILNASKLAFVEKHTEQARIDNLIDNKSVNETYQSVQHKLDNARESTKSKKRKLIQRLILALSIILVSTYVGVEFYKSQANKLSNSLNLFYESIEPEDISNNSSDYKNVSAKDEFISKKLNDVSVALKQKNWDNTLLICRELEDEYKYKTPKIAFYKSIALHYNKDFKGSIEVLEGISKEKGYLSCKIQHLLVLAYLHNKQASKARNQLNLMKSQTNSCRELVINDLENHF